MTKNRICLRIVFGYGSAIYLVLGSIKTKYCSLVKIIKWISIRI